MNRTDAQAYERRPSPIAARRAWLGLAAAALLGAAPAPPLAGNPILSVAAFLLSSQTGRLSPDALSHPELLGNAVAGAASGHAALITVRVSAGGDAPGLTGAHVRLVAVATGRSRYVGGKGGSRRVILDRTISLGSAGPDGNAYAGFWLEGVGCEPIQLDATLLRGAKPPHGHAELGFQCYE